MEAWAEIGTPVTTLNLFEDLVLNNNEDQWHKSNNFTQHISQLTSCGKKAAKSQIYPVPKTISTLGTFEVGRRDHEFFQDRYILKYPSTVKEFPVVTFIYRDIKTGEEIKLKIAGKIDLLDFGNSRIIDIKTSKGAAMRWIKSGSSKAPPGAKKSHVMQVVVYWYLWNHVVINDPKSYYWIKECGISYISKDNFMDLYCPIPLDKYDPTRIFLELVEEAIGVHKAVNLKDWHYLNNKWKYDPNWWLCKDYCEYSEECKRESQT